MKSFAVLLISVLASVNGLIPSALLQNGTEFMRPDKCVQKCTEDCRGIYFCVGDYKMIVDCKTQTGKSYCYPDSVACTDESGFCITSAGNVCYNGMGLHPDVRDCHRFYHCQSNGADPGSYRCEGDAVFDPDHRQCVTGLSCLNFTETDMCKNQEGRLIPHPLNQNYFVKCEKRPKLFKCKLGYVFHQYLIRCEYVCTTVGKFPDEYDKTKYYDCVKIDDSLRTHHEKCSEGTIFDPASKLCK